MKRAAGILALALMLVGCSSELPGREQVRLLTGPPNAGPGNVGCFTFGVNGELIVDPTYGTAIIDRGPGGAGGPTVVAWRPGFTAWRSGSEVAVFDPSGNIVAVTGRRYVLEGGYVAAAGSSGLTWPDLPVGVFWSCGRVTAALPG